MCLDSKCNFTLLSLIPVKKLTRNISGHSISISFYIICHAFVKPCLTRDIIQQQQQQKNPIKTAKNDYLPVVHLVM